MPARLDFSQARQYDTTKPLRESLSTVGSMLGQFQDAELKRQQLQQKADQDAIENQRAQEMLKLQQEAGARAQAGEERTVTGNEALRTYGNQLSNYGQDVVSDEAAQKMLSLYQASPQGKAQAAIEATPSYSSLPASKQTELLESTRALPSNEGALEAMYSKAQEEYNVSPQARLEQLGGLAMPEGQYDPSKLMTVREKAMAVPQAEIAALAEAKIKQAAAEYDRATKYGSVLAFSLLNCLPYVL